MRKLAFIKQPTDIVAGATSNAINVTVLDDNGNPDTAFDGQISITMEDPPFSPDEMKSRPLNAIPKRLRATAPGCEDGISNVFYVLPK